MIIYGMMTGNYATYVTGGGLFPKLVTFIADEGINITPGITPSFFVQC